MIASKRSKKSVHQQTGVNVGVKKNQKRRFRLSDTLQLLLYSALSVVIMAGTYHWLSIQNASTVREADSSFLGTKVYTPLQTFIDSSAKRKKA